MSYHCMVISFARVLGITTEALIDQLLHDGLGKFPGTQVQRTHHVQEILDVACNMGCWFAPVELIPQSFEPKTRRPFEVIFGDGTVSANFDRFKDYLKDSKGVIVGMRGRNGHAVYWNGHECSDQRGSWVLWGKNTDFVPSMYWRAVWI